MNSETRNASGLQIHNSFECSAFEVESHFHFRDYHIMAAAMALAAKARDFLEILQNSGKRNVFIVPSGHNIIKVIKKRYKTNRTHNFGNIS